PHPCAARFFLSTPPRPPRSTPFPYTTLFRSKRKKKVLILEGKTKKPRTINLTNIYDEIQSYINQIDSQWLFPSRKGGNPITPTQDRKSTRLNSSHVKISYAVFCLKTKRRPAT